MIPLLSPPPPANVVWFDELDSTASFAERLMEFWPTADAEPLPETLVLAGRQSVGRGRGGNRWESPAGGLYANWLGPIPVAALALLPIAAGVVLAEAVEELIPGVAVGLKWPNDLQVRGRKLGGVLCRSRGGGDSVWATVGFGINVAISPELDAGDPVRPVSLAALGFSGDAGDAIRVIASRFLTRIRAALSLSEGTRVEWEARSVHRRGDAVRLQLETSVVEGRFAGMGGDGRLELAVAGEVRRFSVGEILSDEAPGGV
ncbi:MAG: biotin--[acetyl-CoA-carboxylase] ligase [Acidobacteria bacterium 37-71-11]|nr:MAG: biotin--[acetyl-CoA-carboxylase] ligase [Acidobacteria bacterium 37-71-11]